MGWILIHNNGFPHAFFRPSGAVLNNTAILFGGTGADYSRSASIYAFDMKNMFTTFKTRSFLITSGASVPSTRNHAAVVFLPSGYLVMQGGSYNSWTWLYDMWWINLSTLIENPCDAAASNPFNWIQQNFPITPPATYSAGCFFGSKSNFTALLGTQSVEC